jgi:hypothetical protein
LKNDQNYFSIPVAVGCHWDGHHCCSELVRLGKVAVDKSRVLCYNVFIAGNSVVSCYCGDILRNHMFSEVVGRVAYVALGIAIGINLFLFGVI